MGGLIFGMVRVLVNWWAYTWGGLYSEVYGIHFTDFTTNMCLNLSR